MRKFKHLALGVLCIILSWSGVAGAEDLNVLLMGSTFRIAGPARGEGKISVGTVFFVGRPLKSSTGRASYVMVTAAHVLQDISGDEAVLWLRRKKADGTFEGLEYKLRIRSKGAQQGGHFQCSRVVLPLEIQWDQLGRVGIQALLAQERRDKPCVQREQDDHRRDGEQQIKCSLACNVCSLVFRHA